VTSADWTLHRPLLTETLNAFYASGLTHHDRRQVHEWLMEACVDPAAIGRPDPEVDGLWFGRVKETAVGVIYSIDRQQMKVFVAVIR